MDILSHYSSHPSLPLGHSIRFSQVTLGALCFWKMEFGKLLIDIGLPLRYLSHSRAIADRAEYVPEQRVLVGLEGIVFDVELVALLDHANLWEWCHLQRVTEQSRHDWAMPARF